MGEACAEVFSSRIEHSMDEDHLAIIAYRYYFVWSLVC